MLAPQEEPRGGLDGDCVHGSTQTNLRADGNDSPAREGVSFPRDMTLLSALFGLLVLASLVAVFRRFLRVAAIGAAYKTKALCSALFVSGLGIDDPDRAPEVSAEAYRLMALFPARVDRERKTVTASFHGLSERTAVWRPGLGATIAFSPVPPAPALAA